MMSCNCKVNQQIDYLHKKYGHEIPVSKTKKVSFTVGETFKNIFVALIAIVLSPILLLHILYVSIFKKDKTISAKKLMNLTKARK